MWLPQFLFFFSRGLNTSFTPFLLIMVWNIHRMSAYSQKLLFKHKNILYIQMFFFLGAENHVLHQAPIWYMRNKLIQVGGFLLIAVVVLLYGNIFCVGHSHGIAIFCWCILKQNTCRPKWKWVNCILAAMYTTFFSWISFKFSARLFQHSLGSGFLAIIHSNDC